MVRFAIVFLLGVALGSVVAVATTQFLAQHAATSPSAAAPADSVAKVGPAFEDAVARALRRVQSEARAAMSSKSSPVESRDPAPGDASGAHASESGVTITRDTKTPLREKNTVRLNELFVRTKEAQSKRRREWMFVSESAVGAELGLPDRVNPNGDGGETWVYDIPYTNGAGDLDNEQLEITLLRGRVIRVDGAEAIPEQR